jgi:hypothetical protein
METVLYILRSTPPLRAPYVEWKCLLRHWKWITGICIAAALIGFVVLMPTEEKQALAVICGPLILLGVVCCLYFLPAIVGSRKRNSGAIFILNLFLGWTFVGWVVALVWATIKED